MNKPTQPDKKSMDEKIEKILDDPFCKENCRARYCDGKIKRLAKLFTESLKGQRAELIEIVKEYKCGKHKKLLQAIREKELK